MHGCAVRTRSSSWSTWGVALPCCVTDRRWQGRRRVGLPEGVDCGQGPPPQPAPIEGGASRRRKTRGERPRSRFCSQGDGASFPAWQSGSVGPARVSPGLACTTGGVCRSSAGETPRRGPFVIERCARLKIGVSAVDPVSLFGEFKRRRVFRALIAYGIAAFAALQIVEPITHALHWPDAVLSYVVVALAAGFPIVVTVAWIFDVKAGRIERAPAARLRGVPLAAVLIAIGVVAAAPGLFYFFVVRSPARTVSAPASIAVLPFVNMSSDKESDYFSDGITEELINALANVEGLRVTSRTSAFAFKGRNVSVRTIGEELAVATVLEGSVRREGSAVRITAQLINAADGYHLWSQTYDRELRSVFTIEDELARSIVQALRPRLVKASSPLVRQPTANIEAHDLYLRGRHFWNKRTEQELMRAMEASQQAIDLDPSYALAHVGLADSKSILVEYGTARPANALPKAMAHAQKALELDGDLAEAHASLGLISTYEFD